MTRPLIRLAGSFALAWGILVAGPRVHAQYDVRVDSSGRFVAPTAQKLWESNFLALAWKFLTNAVQSSNNTSVALDEANLKLLISATGGTNGGGTVSLGTNLTQLDALNFVSGDMIYHSGSTLDRLATTAAGRALLTAADAAAQRTLLGVFTNTNYQPQSQVLSNLAALLNGNTSNYFRGDGTFAQISSNHIAGLVQAFSDLNGLISGKQGTSLVLNSLVGLSLTNGDILTVSNGQLVRLAIPAQNGKTLLSTNGLFVFWGDPPSASGAGTVTSVDISNRLSGLTISGGPITVSGSFILDGILGLASGGSGASNAAQARTNFGLVIGVNVQAYNTNLATLAALTSGNSTNFFAGDGSYKQVTTNMVPGLVAILAALEPLNSNKYQASNTVLTTLATLNGANLTNLNGSSIASGTVADARIDSAIARLAGPTFTGDPKAPTPSAGDNDTSIATTAFVLSEIARSTNYAGATVTNLIVTGSFTIPHLAYSSAWSGSTNGVDRDAIYTQLHIGDTNDDGKIDVLGSAPTAGGTNIMAYIASVAAGAEPLNANKYQSTNGNLTTAAAAGFTGSGPLVRATSGALTNAAFYGDPTAPTPATSDNDTSVATTAYVQAVMAANTNYLNVTVSNLTVSVSLIATNLTIGQSITVGGSTGSVGQVMVKQAGGISWTNLIPSGQFSSPTLSGSVTMAQTTLLPYATVTNYVADPTAGPQQYIMATNLIVKFIHATNIASGRQCVILINSHTNTSVTVVLPSGIMAWNTNLITMSANQLLPISFTGYGADNTNVMATVGQVYTR